MASTSFSANSPYRRLAKTLDSFPNRFPPADDGSDLRLLAKIFSPEEADLAACLTLEMETPQQIAERTGRELRGVMQLLKAMVHQGQIVPGKNAEGRLAFALMPFVVGIYEAQNARMDAEMAELFEDYYQNTFKTALAITPPVHRVIPIGASVENDMAIMPYESVDVLLHDAQSWGVINCICRMQKALIGEPCQHPVEVCMVLSNQPEAFSAASGIRSLTHDEAKSVLMQAANAGLVHCVSNQQKEITYICNCCTCSCSVLRGMAEMGIASVVAGSAFNCVVDDASCISCGECETACPFGAITLHDVAVVNTLRCAGCGVCVPVCPQGALKLENRVQAPPPPLDAASWRESRRVAD